MNTTIRVIMFMFIFTLANLTVVQQSHAQRDRGSYSPFVTTLTFGNDPDALTTCERLSPDNGCDEISLTVSKGETVYLKRICARGDYHEPSSIVEPENLPQSIQDALDAHEASSATDLEIQFVADTEGTFMIQTYCLMMSDVQYPFTIDLPLTVEKAKETPASVDDDSGDDKADDNTDDEQDDDSNTPTVTKVEPTPTGSDNPGPTESTPQTTAPSPGMNLQGTSCSLSTTAQAPAMNHWLLFALLGFGFFVLRLKAAQLSRVAVKPKRDQDVSPNA